MICDFESIGVTSKSKVASVLRQSCFDQVALEAAAAAVRRLIFGQRGEELRGWPAFLVGLRRQFWPARLHARQAQFGEQQLDARGVEGHRGCHGAISMSGFVTGPSIVASSL